MINNQTQTLLNMVHTLLLEKAKDEVITSEVITQQVALMQSTLSMAGMIQADVVDTEYVTEDLIRKFSISIGNETSISDYTNHQPWLDQERKQGRRYWERYKKLIQGDLPWSAVDSIDLSTDEVLSKLEDPKRDGTWDRRGMVVGHVQSGKTANYTGLICKAADAGYKIIIVLAGIHNNLRAQTQIRLDEGFLGFETSPNHGSKAPIGVGLIDQDIRLQPQFATHRLETGDFNGDFAKQLGVTPEERPWLFVVKKNVSVLKGLLEWIQDHVATQKDSEDKTKNKVTHLPLLIIDDEADNASVDTGETVTREDGSIDTEHDPKPINKLIRKILHSFSRKAYVGYTATPFANIFIHEQGETETEGPDLFPSAFITNLSAPSNYVGPSRMFGYLTFEGREGALPLTRKVDDHCSDDHKDGWMPPSHKSDHFPKHESREGFPQSLRESVDSFVLGCVVRHLRGHGRKHNSMLIHVSRFTKVQNLVHEKVNAYIEHLRQVFDRKTGSYDDIVKRLELLWNTDFVPTAEKIEGYRITDKSKNGRLKLIGEIQWQEIVEALPDTIKEIKVKSINGTAGDILDYKDSTGAKVIAVGGDKLARGLTLEGLTCSYFLRASKMYDTLMQMGRWFGYREGYLDLCRLHTTPDLIQWFEHIADSAQELRDEFDAMASCGGTPKDFGLKVQAHPDLLITSPLKMRSAQDLNMSFNGTICETTSLFRDPVRIADNFRAFESLTESLGTPVPAIERVRGNKIKRFKGAFWENASWVNIVDFLKKYKTTPESFKVRSDVMADYITTMAEKHRELTTWTVAVVNGSVKDKIWSASDSVDIAYNVRRKKEINENTYSIGRLISPEHEALDFDGDAWSAALKWTVNNWEKRTDKKKSPNAPEQPSGIFIRKVRGLGEGLDNIKGTPEKGLLIIYLMDPASADAELQNDCDPVVGIGISFPDSKKSQPVKYRVNNTLWKSKYEIN